MVNDTMFRRKTPSPDFESEVADCGWGTLSDVSDVDPLPVPGGW